MPHPRKFRFGVQLANAGSHTSWADAARKAEDLGYSSLFLPDHFGDQFAPVPALAAAAAVATTLRVGALVWDNDYKHPVVLAKEAATIDVISGGRLEFGIRAGWMNTDYEQSGIPKDAASVRIARLTEAVAIYKGLWGPGEFSFSGEHYSISKLDGLPKPVQQPHPPVLIGGGGPKMIALAAREADIVGVNPTIVKGYVDPSSASEIAPAQIGKKVDQLREEAGDRFKDLELNILVFATMIGQSASARREQMSELLSITVDDLDATPNAWIGDTASIVDKLRAARDRWGMSYFVVQGEAAMDQAAPLVAELAGT